MVGRYLFFFKQKTAYEMRISDWSSDVCSSDLPPFGRGRRGAGLDCRRPALGVRGGHPHPGLPDRARRRGGRRPDRKSVVSGRSVSVRVDRGGRRYSKKKDKRPTRGQDQENKP